MRGLEGCGFSGCCLGSGFLGCCFVSTRSAVIFLLLSSMRSDVINTRYAPPYISLMDCRVFDVRIDLDCPGFRSQHEVVEDGVALPRLDPELAVFPAGFPGIEQRPIDFGAPLLKVVLAFLQILDNGARRRED